MTEEILINVTPRETRVALVENGMLQEVRAERTSKRGHVGNIYKGKVTRIMPGMQAAFIQIGLERAAFLHASDIIGARGTVEGPDGTVALVERPIAELIRDGQELVVQIAKDPIGGKGARVTMHLSLPSRLLVMLPYDKVIGVSARIEDEAERERLRSLLADLSGDDGPGYIARTNAAGQSSATLIEDIRYLSTLWAALRRSIADARVGTCIYEELPLAVRALRDQMNPQVEKVRVDSREMLERVRRFATQFMPQLVGRVEHYPGARPIFDLYGVEDEIDRALKREVPLKSGGHVVFDQTEAMTTVDVNTGAYLGARNLEETAFRTNLEAAQTVARQLRLRGLGGIIIIDFIDMNDAEHKRQVLRQLTKSLANDRAKTSVYDISELGLVQMTRQRTTESLEHLLCEPCPTCAGSGSIKSAETVTYEIFREITRAVRQFDANKLLVLASPKVVMRIVDEESAAIAELEEFIGKTISFQAEPQYSQEQYDVVLL